MSFYTDYFLILQFCDIWNNNWDYHSQLLGLLPMDFFHKLLSIIKYVCVHAHMHMIIWVHV